MAPNENARKWVEALRSGEYEQGKRRLCRDGKHCCLGVACEVAIKNGVEIERRDYGGTIYFDGHCDLLPEKVREWLGLNSDGGRYLPLTGKKSDLATRNDSGADFKRIANIIESRSRGLFVEAE